MTDVQHERILPLHCHSIISFPTLTISLSCLSVSINSKPLHRQNEVHCCRRRRLCCHRYCFLPCRHFRPRKLKFRIVKIGYVANHMVVSVCSLENMIPNDLKRPTDMSQRLCICVHIRLRLPESSLNCVSRVCFH